MSSLWLRFSKKHGRIRSSVASAFHKTLAQDKAAFERQIAPKCWGFYSFLVFIQGIYVLLKYMDCRWKRVLRKEKVNSQASLFSLINGSQQNMLSFVTFYLSLKQFLLFAEWLKFLFLIIWGGSCLSYGMISESSKSLFKWVSLQPYRAMLHEFICIVSRI